MLAYIFWHAPAAEIERNAYQDALAAFHQRLGTAGASGFIRSETHRIDSVPWLSGSPAYEDWYLVADSAALDALEAAAVGARLGSSHDAVAALAAAGAGGLYKCLLEGAPLGPETAAEWLSKRAGATSPAFIQALRAQIPAGGWLWQRKLVLGPAPEFCVVRPSDGGGVEDSLPLLRTRIFPKPK